MWEESHESSNRRVSGGLNVKMTNARNQMEFCIYKLWVGNKCKFIQSHKFYSKSVCVCFFPRPAKVSGRSLRPSTSRSMSESEKKTRSCPVNSIRCHISSSIYTQSNKKLSAHKPGSSQSLVISLTHTNAALWPQVTPHSFITFLPPPPLSRQCQRNHCSISCVKTPRSLLHRRMEWLSGLSSVDFGRSERPSL